MISKRNIMSAAVFALLASTTGANAAEISVYCQNIAVGCGSLEPIAKAFEKENPGTTVRLEVVNYQTILESLPIQLESGKGPDAAIVTDLGGLARYYLDMAPYVDANLLEKEYGSLLAWLRGADPSGKSINGVPLTMTVNGAYVNATLFDQAGIPLPKDGATWEDWAKASRDVAKATGVDFPMEMDRSGHRFSSLAISYGAQLVDDNGNPVVDEGLKKAIEQFVAWHKDGTMPMDLWGAVGGATHRELFSDFLNAKTVFYFGGSWTIGQMDRDVGGLFDWRVVPTPCGPSSCTAMPGGSALVGFKSSAHPEIVGKFLGYVAKPENLAALVVASKEIPTAKSLVEKGIKYEGASERTQASLATFTAQISKMAPAAYRFQGWRFQRAMMNAMTTRVSQVLNDELDVDTALARIKQDVELAMKAGK
ncbi:ABC transporter substrate-binding protein [Agrobacterium sp. P15N1-A]|uniref:ABC transporter substrate-binding protein n=1 Tax=Agrobacterium sp. P15N1-A TaxID=3342820 RepID=UPI0037DCC110